MIILFKTHVDDAQIALIQESLKVYSRQTTYNGFKGLMISAAFNQELLIPSDLIEDVIEYSDKLYFTRHEHAQNSFVMNISGVSIGGAHIASIAGPCSIESEKQITQCAALIKKAGGQILRGGAYKPRSSCYDFQGMGLEGLKLLNQAAKAHGLLCVSELMDSRDLDKFESLVDIIQVGARNMQNYALLKELGQSSKPILLKRGLCATYQEFLSSAEYIMSSGNEQVILCERGIRTFEQATRNTLDISAIPYLKSKTNCPVIIDPSHAIGIRQFVPSLAYAAVAAGADGVMLEVHPSPDESYSDAKQTIAPDTFSDISSKLSEIAKLFGRTFGA